MLTRLRYKAEEIARRATGQIATSAWFSGRSERFSEISQWIDQVDEAGTVLLAAGALGTIYKLDGIASETDSSSPSKRGDLRMAWVNSPSMQTRARSP